MSEFNEAVKRVLDARKKVIDTQDALILSLWEEVKVLKAELALIESEKMHG